MKIMKCDTYSSFSINFTIKRSIKESLEKAVVDS